MRCATVGGAVRKARAISSVVRPQTSRSVSATCASGGSAGWQQVKISRSRSSSTLLVVPVASPSRASASSRSASSASDASNRARRRMRVDRLEAAGRDEPRARIVGHAVARPLLDRRREGVVQRLLGEVEVAEQADQRGEDAARLGAVDGVDPARVPARPRPHSSPVGSRYGRSSSRIGRTSTLPRRADGIREATWMASFRSRASMR